jgi:MSHA biogenesis protein MshP
MRPERQQGFSLITAIFLLVVVASLIGYMVSLAVVQHGTLAMAVQGSRALQAARSGLEHAAYRALQSGSCPASETLSFGSDEPALQAFRVTVECSSSTHVEATSTLRFYRLTALAESGSYVRNGMANPDYVSRRLRMTVSTAPP